MDEQHQTENDQNKESPMDRIQKAVEKAREDAALCADTIRGRDEKYVSLGHVEGIILDLRDAMAALHDAMLADGRDPDRYLRHKAEYPNGIPSYEVPEWDGSEPTSVVIERLIHSGMSRDAAVSHLQRQVERGEWSLDDRFNVAIPSE